MDLSDKLKQLKKGVKQQNRLTHFQSTDPDENSHNDYDSSSLYLSKLETSSKKFNTSMNNFNSKSKTLGSELVEVDAHLEATPNSSSKHIGANCIDEDPKVSNFNETSVTFNGAYLRHLNKDKKKKTSNLSHSSGKPRRQINDYIQRDNFTKMNLKPLKSQMMTAKEVHQNYRYSSSDITEEYPLEKSDKKLANIYLRTEKLKEKIQRSTTNRQGLYIRDSKTHECYRKKNSDGPAGTSANSSSHFPNMTQMHPQQRDKLKKEIWRLPTVPKQGE